MKSVQYRCLYVLGIFLASTTIVLYFNVIKNYSKFGLVPLQLMAEMRGGNFKISEPSLNVDSPLPNSAEEKYLLYTRGGDYCAGVQHSAWSLSCALGEAILLNRTLVLEDTFCVPGVHNDGKKLESNISLYFDIPKLKKHAKIIERSKFSGYLNDLVLKDVPFNLTNVPASTPTSKITKINSLVVTRQLATHQYAFQICEENKQVQRLWPAVWAYSRQIMDVSWKICGELNWDFDAVHIRRGDKSSDKRRWPNLDADTRPPKLLETLLKKVKPGRTLYIATNEKKLSLFEPLSSVYKVRFLQNFSQFWEKGSAWWNWRKEHLKSDSIEPYFDGAMKGMVDYLILEQAKLKIETFNDLTTDPKHGIK